MFLCGQMFSFLLAIYLGIELLYHMVKYFMELPNCFPKHLHHFKIPSAMYLGSNFSTSSPTLEIFVFFMIAILLDVKQHIIMVFIYISLRANDIKHLFMCLLTICTSLVICLFRSFAHFYLVICFSLLSYKKPLYTLDTSPLYCKI